MAKPGSDSPADVSGTVRGGRGGGTAFLPLSGPLVTPMLTSVKCMSLPVCLWPFCERINLRKPFSFRAFSAACRRRECLGVLPPA